jgi:hypothetical protein
MRNALIVAAAAFALGGLTAGSDAQGRGQDKGQGKGAAPAQVESRGQAKGQAMGGGSSAQAPAQTKGRPAAAPGQQRQQPPGSSATAPGQSGAAPGRSAQAPGQQRAAFARVVNMNDVPAAVRTHVTSGRRPQMVAGGALARAHIRGAGDDFRLVPTNDRVTLTNRRGAVLVALDDNAARNLGVWNVNAFDAPVNSGSPAFCRSGAGHPVWGRQWCLDKGFGLGQYQDVRWGRTSTIGDIIFGRTIEPGRLTTESLLRVLGATAFNRLALHAVTLGYTEPLVGTWATDPAEPNVLFVNAGPAPVAEMIDVNRDGRPDLMLVALRPW